MHFCHRTGREVRGQLAGVGALLPPCEFWGLNSGHWTWWQALLPTEPSQQPSEWFQYAQEQLMVQVQSDKGAVYTWRIDSHYQRVIMGTVFGMIIREEFYFIFIIFKTSLGIKI